MRRPARGKLPADLVFLRRSASACLADLGSCRVLLDAVRWGTPPPRAPDRRRHGRNHRIARIAM